MTPTLEEKKLLVFLTGTESPIFLSEREPVMIKRFLEYQANLSDSLSFAVNQLKMIRHIALQIGNENLMAQCNAALDSPSLNGYPDTQTKIETLARDCEQLEKEKESIRQDALLTIKEMDERVMELQRGLTERDAIIQQLETALKQKP